MTTAGAKCLRLQCTTLVCRSIASTPRVALVHASRPAPLSRATTKVPKHCMNFHTTATTMVTPQYSAGEDAASLDGQVQRLTQGKSRWTLCNNGKGLERSFKFKTFKAAWTFMNSVAEEGCKSERHHPEWSNVYNRVFVRWTTHNPSGLSSKDIRLAELCDSVASRKDSPEIQDSSDASSLRATADLVANEAGDCCQPKGTAGASKLKEKAQIEAEEKAEGAQGSVAGMGGQPS